MKSLSNRDAPWQVRAIDALWRDTDRSKILLQTPPELGVQYSLQLKNSSVKKGDVVDILYEGPLQFYNGYETLEDLNQIRICKGLIVSTEEVAPTDDVYKEAVQDIKFEVMSSISFKDFTNFEPTKILDQNWGVEFLEGNYSVRVHQIGEFILVDWTSEGYSGDDCIIRQSNSGYQVLFLTGYFPSDANWVRAGNLIPPMAFVDRLSDRLLKMGDEMRWYGEKL